MKHVKKSVLLWYSAREMYELVVDVESYPKFLPWCESSTILEQHPADPATGTLAGMPARLVDRVPLKGIEGDFALYAPAERRRA